MLFMLHDVYLFSLSIAFFHITDIFKNLPYFRWKSSRGFEEGNSNIYRATAEVNAAWAWYMPKMKDNSDESPIAIRFIARPTYGAMSFVSTKADLHTFTYTD